MTTDILGKGLRFPFQFHRRSGGARISTTTSADHAHIHESIIQILGTRPGERLMNPEFGAQLRDLVFQPNDHILRGLLRHYIIDALTRWEKRIQVTDVSFEDSESNTISASISYRIIQTQVEGNMVYPFCLDDLAVGSADRGKAVSIG